LVCNTVAKCGKTKPFQDRALIVSSLVGSMTARLRHSVVAVATAAAMLGGCASGDTGAAEVWDPIETPNRFIFSFNRVVDLIAGRPLAVFYRDWMPEGGQRGVRNVIDNLGEPVTAINEVVQGSPGRAATTLGRFLVNSTIGIAGGRCRLEDGAEQDQGRCQQDWLLRWRRAVGRRLLHMLPVIGPSNAVTVGLAIDAAIDPFSTSPFP
jgi:phospholipid-binding lipoprotein MlaA